MSEIPTLEVLNSSPEWAEAEQRMCRAWSAFGQDNEMISTPVLVCGMAMYLARFAYSFYAPEHTQTALDEMAHNAKLICDGWRRAAAARAEAEPESKPNGTGVVH